MNLLDDVELGLLAALLEFIGSQLAPPAEHALQLHHHDGIRHLHDERSIQQVFQFAQASEPGLQMVEMGNRSGKQVDILEHAEHEWQGQTLAYSLCAPVYEALVDQIPEKELEYQRKSCLGRSLSV